ncbi:unnamed protein product [Lupinus luteus]|uniref:Senescence-associated protein n=2 Tax=Lupinus luteus TaxID=3873 RepID=A0AAV1VYC7_LUPLU
MIGRADIEGSKSNVAMNAWLPQASYPCGNFSDTSSFKFRRTKGSIGHAFTVRIRTGNQNQTSFYPFVPHEISVLVELILGHLRYLLTDVPPQPNSPPDNVFRPDRPTEAGLGGPEGPVPIPSPDRHAATRSRRESSSSSPPTADGFGTGTPVPSPQSQSFSRGYGSILPTSLAYIVQRLDGSRDSAIHTKYRISLRSSSMQEPRYPLPRVFRISVSQRRPHEHRLRAGGGKLNDFNFLGAFGAGVLLLGQEDTAEGSPTETLLRLLLPLNDKVQWTSHNVAGSEPPTSPQSEHFTGPFNRAGGTTRPVKARSASPAEGTSRPVHTNGGPIDPTQAVSQAPSPESNPNSPSPVTTMDQPGSIHQRLCSTCKCCHHERLSKTDTTAKCYSREPKNQRDSTGQTHQPAFAACTASKGTLDTCENASHYNSQLTHHTHPFRILQRPLEGAWMERVIRGT